MISLLLALNLATSMLAAPNAKFNYLYNHLSESEQSILESNAINTDEEFDEFVMGNYSLKTKGSADSHSKAIEDLSEELSIKYPNYYWTMSYSNTTKSASNAIPINMQGDDFPTADIKTAIADTGVPSYYGGCGPIAMMGIMDYFSRYLGYNEYIADPTSSSERIALAKDVLRKSTTYEVGFTLKDEKKSTLMFPWDYENAFDSLTKDYGLEGVIDTSFIWRVLGVNQGAYWKIIIENIDKGLPVTLMAGPWSGDGEFANHYTNIYGYTKLFGYNYSTGEAIEKNYIKARLNWSGNVEEFYCDANILNDGLTALITYNINYESSYDVYASDFREAFVNSNGGGQYFFDNKFAPVITENGGTLYTNRKRCSYIENQYLVLSPNRENAGEAYLEVILTHNVSKIKFSSSLWSANEGITLENFKFQYYLNGWNDHVNFDLSRFSTSKLYPNDYTILLPKNARGFRLLATHSNPAGSRNKGRIILDNFTFEHNR